MAARTPPDSSRPVSVALYNGVYVDHDAISNSIRRKLHILSGLDQAGLAVNATVFTHHTDTTDPRVHRARSTHEVLAAPEFRAADIHCFEFGIGYNLFDCLFLVPHDRLKLAVYHNVTPLELVKDDRSRTTIRWSLVQKHNLALADRVVCDSEFNRDDLLAFGIPAERLSVLHLPAGHEPVLRFRPWQSESDPADPVRLLFVGRFVPSKAPTELVRALADLMVRGHGGFTATLVGNRAFSDPDTVDEVELLCREHRLEDVIHFAGQVTDDALAELFAGADALVIPSYHEGYCIPVVEALGAGCFVIAYDAGNLPYVVDGLGAVTPTGDVAALSDAIGDFVNRVRQARQTRRPALLPTARGPMAEDEWRDAVTAHLREYSAEAYDQAFLDVLEPSVVAVVGSQAWAKARRILAVESGRKVGV